MKPLGFDAQSDGWFLATMVGFDASKSQMELRFRRLQLEEKMRGQASAANIPESM